MAMRAVFTDNPYDFWKRDGGAELHLFDDEHIAERYLAYLNEFNQLADDFGNGATSTPCMCESPNDLTGMCAETWAQLVIAYASCRGLDKVFFHASAPVEDAMDLIEWHLGTLEWGTAVNWTWPGEWPFVEGVIFSDMSLDLEDCDVWKGVTWREEKKKLCDLLHYLFDVVPFEWHDPDTNEVCDIVMTEEIVNA